MKIWVLFGVVVILFFFSWVIVGEILFVLGVEVYFVNFNDGDMVLFLFKVVFGLLGMGVVLVGVDKENIGYYYLLINWLLLGQGEDGEDEYIYSLFVDDNYKYFGGGQIEIMLELVLGMYII